MTQFKATFQNPSQVVRAMFIAYLFMAIYRPSVPRIFEGNTQNDERNSLCMRMLPDK